MARLLLCFFLFANLLTFTSQTTAQGTCDWEYSFDFTSSDYASYGWEGAWDETHWATEQGWLAGPLIYAGAWNTYVGVKIDLPYATTITGVEAQFITYYGTFAAGSADFHMYGDSGAHLYHATGPAGSTRIVRSALSVGGVERFTFTMGGNPGSGTDQTGLDEIIIRGVGVDPFTGADDCEGPDASFTADPVEGSAPLTVTFHNTSTNATSFFWDFGDGNTSTSSATFVQHTYEYPAIYIATLIASDSEDDDSAFQTIEVDNEATLGAAASYKPLRSTDDHPAWGMFDTHYICELMSCNETFPYAYEFVSAYATGVNKDVHAIGAGVVEEIVGPGSVACDSSINSSGLVNGNCQVFVPDVLTSSGTHIYRLDVDQLYRVTVNYQDIVWIDYYVTDPKVSVGDEVTAGCIIGKTVTLLPFIGTFPIGYGVLTAPTPDDSWVGLIGYFPDSAERLYPKLIAEPDNLVPCNADPNFARCAGDSQLQNPAEWTTNGGVIWNPGAKPQLQPFASIQFANSYYISSETAYSLTVQARTLGAGAGSLDLQIGQTTQSFTISNQLSVYQIPASIHVADLGFFYTVGAANSGSVPVEIVSFCLAEGDVYSQPGSCYFLNPSFDDNLTHWTTSPGVNAWVTSGQILMNDGDTIAQTAAQPLYPNGASSWDYYVTLRAAVIGDGWESASTSTVGFEWEFPSGGATGTFLSPASTSTYAFSSFKVNVPNNLNTFAGNEILFQAVLPISVATSGAFTLTANLDLNDGFVGGVLLRELCVNDPLAQWPDDGVGGGIDPPYTPSCTRVSPPTTNDIGAWTFFHWASLDRFFQCDMMITLNQINQTANTTLHFIRWQALYQQATAQAWANWIPQNLIPWLNGHFRNMAVGSVTVVNQDSGGCHDIFCLADSFFSGTFGLLGPIVDLVVSLITQGANLLFAVIVALLTIFIALIGQVWTLFTSLGQWLGSLVGAWNNATPITPEFLPSCATDYTSSAFCMGVFALENTIFSGPGALLIPFLIGFGSLSLLLWAVGTIRDVISSIGKSV